MQFPPFLITHTSCTYVPYSQMDLMINLWEPTPLCCVIEPHTQWIIAANTYAKKKYLEHIVVLWSRKSGWLLGKSINNVCKLVRTNMKYELSTRVLLCINHSCTGNEWMLNINYNLCNKYVVSKIPVPTYVLTLSPFKIWCGYFLPQIAFFFSNRRPLIFL